MIDSTSCTYRSVFRFFPPPLLWIARYLLVLLSFLTRSIFFHPHFCARPVIPYRLDIDILLTTVHTSSRTTNWQKHTWGPAAGVSRLSEHLRLHRPLFLDITAGIPNLEGETLPFLMKPAHIGPEQRLNMSVTGPLGLNVGPRKGCSYGTRMGLGQIRGLPGKDGGCEGVATTYENDACGWRKVLHREWDR